MRRQTLILVLTAIVLGTLLSLATIFIYFQLRSVCEEEDICLTPECVQTAAKILSYLNTSVDPCENFYQFSCGNFLGTTEIPENKDYISTSSILHDEVLKQLKDTLEEAIERSDPEYAHAAKNYYRACSDIETTEKQGLTFIRSILYQIGGWPVLEGFAWNERNFSWYQHAYNFRHFGIDTNFFITVTIDLQDPTNPHGPYSIQVDVPRLNNFQNTLMLQNYNGKFYYHRFMVSVAKYMGANESRAVHELTQSLEFEIHLALISTMKDEEPLHLTITELEKQFGNIPWFDYLNNFAASQFVIARDERVVILAPRYLRNLDLLLSKTPARVQANYIVWRTISSLIPYLTNDLKEREFAYKNAINRFEEKHQRWVECISETYDKLPLIVSSLYVRKHFDVESKTTVTMLHQRIKQEYLNLIETAEWMDETAKERMTERITRMTHFVAFPEEILHPKMLTAIYGPLKIDPGDYLQSYFNVRLFEHAMNVRKLRESPMVENWEEARIVGDTVAFYDRYRNHLILSAGILQGFFYNKRLPNYLNYGGIGFKIAKEITQVFEQQHTHKNGYDSNQFRPQTENSYLERVQCFIEQYDKFIVREIYENINGTTTSTKNVADSIGLKVAYLTYQKLVENQGKEKKLAALEYTPNQLFWISYVINQCSKEKAKYLRSLLSEYGDIPSEFRVTGALSNLEYFSRDFRCKIDSTMNPALKCAII